MATAKDQKTALAHGHHIHQRVKVIFEKHGFIGPIWGPNHKKTFRDTRSKISFDYRIITLTSGVYDSLEQDHMPVIADIKTELSEYKFKWRALQFDDESYPEIASLELYFACLDTSKGDGNDGAQIPADNLPFYKIEYLPHQQQKIHTHYSPSHHKSLQALINRFSDEQRADYNERVRKIHQLKRYEWWGQSSPFAIDNA